MQLYRHALKNVISWAVRREIFYEEVRLRKYYQQACELDCSCLTCCPAYGTASTFPLKRSRSSPAHACSMAHGRLAAAVVQLK